MSDDPQTPQPADANSDPPEKPIFSIYNFHVPGCGEPPSIEVTAKTNGYYGYFQSQHSDQWVFTYDFDTETGILRGGDIGWETVYAVVDGRAPRLVAREEEQIWLDACWLVVSNYRQNRDEVRHADGTDLKDRPRTSWKTTTTDGKPIVLSRQAGCRYLDGALLVVFHPQREEASARVDTEDQSFYISHEDFVRLMEA